MTIQLSTSLLISFIALFYILIKIIGQYDLRKTLTFLIVGLYLFSIIFSSLFIKNSDIGTIINPIVFYVIVNIILRNNPQENHIKRLNDINDMALLSYGISYLLVKKIYSTYSSKIINHIYLDKADKISNTFNLKVAKYELIKIKTVDFQIIMFSIFIIIIMLFIMVFIFLISALSKLLNENSHWYNSDVEIINNSYSNTVTENKSRLIYSKNKTIYDEKGNIKKDVTKNKYKKEG